MLSQFLTLDSNIELHDGMQIKVHRYTVTGGPEVVPENQGNTQELDVNYVEIPYTVETSQVRWHYTDEAAMTDSYYVDRGVESIGKALVNEYNQKAIAEYKKSENITYTGTTSVEFGNFADAIASLNLEDVDEKGYFALVNPKMKAILRKTCKDDLKYVEAFSRIGYIGSICNIPVYTDKLCDDNEVIIADKTAVTCFLKKDVQVEQDRNCDTRQNYIWGRNVKVIALTDEDHCCKIRTGSATYEAVTPVGTENPKNEGWYEKNASNEYVKTEDTTVTAGKTYYKKTW